jgi:hypothetical protein
VYDQNNFKYSRLRYDFRISNSCGGKMMKQLWLKKRTWFLGAALTLLSLGAMQSCGKDNGHGAGGVTFFGAGS